MWLLPCVIWLLQRYSWMIEPQLASPFPVSPWKIGTVWRRQGALGKGRADNGNYWWMSLKVLMNIWVNGSRYWSCSGWYLKHVFTCVVIELRYQRIGLGIESVWVDIENRILTDNNWHCARASRYETVGVAAIEWGNYSSGALVPCRTFRSKCMGTVFS